MHRTHGLYVPTHRPLPVSSVKADIEPVEGSTQVRSIAPFRLTKVLLIVGSC